MKKTDNKRLSKAILISIGLHIFILLGMNLLNWFPTENIKKKYTPLTVKIESRTVETSSNEIKIENKDSQIETYVAETEVGSVAQIVPKIETAPVVSSTDTVFDPYADLGMNTGSSSSDPEPLEEGVRETPYVPKSKNKIELEDLPTNTGTNNLASSDLTSAYSEDNNVSVVSDNELLDLKSAISGSNDQRVSVSGNQSDSETSSFEYRDVPVEFDIPGESRELLTNPPPEIPDDLPSDFPPEITYHIRFSLNSDGLIKVLSITHSLVYPEIDASIRKALRSWTFKGSSGSELVEGTITLIFKGK